MNRFMVLLAASSVFAMPAHGATALTSVANGVGSNQFFSDETLGWTFTANSNVNVTSLGWFAPIDAQLNSSHLVGIWNSLGVLLGSTTVTAGAADATFFRYANVASPIALISGQSYIIGGEDKLGDGDNFYFNTNGLTTDPAITFGGSARSANRSGFALPTIFTPGNRSYFGPNFQFGAALPAVPEPTTWAMLILGFGAVGAGMRRRKTSLSYA